MTDTAGAVAPESQDSQTSDESKRRERRERRKRSERSKLLSQREALHSIAVELNRGNQIETAKLAVLQQMGEDVKQLVCVTRDAQDFARRMPDQSQLIGQIMELIRVPLELAAAKSERPPAIHSSPSTRPNHVAVHQTDGIRVTQEARMQEESEA